MNALVTFRSNGLGNLMPSKAQREAASEQVSANFRVKLEALVRQLTGAPKSTAKAETAQSPSTAPQAQAAPDELGRDAFLRLLVLQLQNQDPTEPVDNTDMIAQLAQFSSLEQMNNLNQSFTGLSERMEYLLGNIDQLNFISAQGLIGRHVDGVRRDAGQNVEVSGRVESVHLQGSIVVLTVDGESLPMTGVLRVGGG